MSYKSTSAIAREIDIPRDELFDKLEDSIKRAYKMIKECPCTSEDGCPRCTYSYRCGNNNEYLDKKGAEEVLFRIINNEIKDIGKPVDNEKTFTYKNKTITIMCVVLCCV